MEPNASTRSGLPTQLLITIVIVSSASWIASSVYSIDFGHHWDESKQADLVNAFRQHKVLLPIRKNGDEFYNYPSFLYWVSMAGGGLTRLAKSLASGGESWSDNDLQWMWTQTTRILCLLLSIVPSIAILAWLGRLKPFGAVSSAFSTLIVLSSWQLSYHSKWIAPDALLVPATCAFIASLVWRWNHSEKGLSPMSMGRVAPFCTAGIAASIKYQAGVFIVSAILCELMINYHHGKRLVRSAHALSIQIITFVATFAIITPGSVLQFEGFTKDLVFESHHYSTGHATLLGAAPYDVKHIAEYASDLLSFLFVRLPLPFAGPSLLVTLVSAFGAYGLFRYNKQLAATIYAWPLILFVFYSTRSVFIARNFLLFLPIIAISFGLGVDHLLKVARGNAFQRVVGHDILLASFFISLILMSQAYIYTGNLEVKAWRVLEKGPRSAALRNKMMRHFLSGHDSCVYASPSVTESYSILRRTLDDNTCQRKAYLVSTKDLRLAQAKSNKQKLLRSWPATGAFHYKFLGPPDVDFDFYPTWRGLNRVLLFTDSQYNQLFTDRALDALSIKAYRVSSNRI